VQFVKGTSNAIDALLQDKETRLDFIGEAFDFNVARRQRGK
jgi:hypothetical protein